MNRTNVMKQALTMLQDVLEITDGATRDIDWAAANAAMSNLIEAIELQAKPHGWMTTGSSIVLRGKFAEQDAKAEAKRCGGTCYAYPVYLGDECNTNPPTTVPQS